MTQPAGKILVIAEKPDAARDIASALWKVTKKEEVYEGEKYVISSAVGHLAELCLPGELDKKRGKWSFANLPIIPDHFELKANEKGASRLKLLRQLLRRADIVGVINACDAGREGELIFHYVMQLLGSKKPFRRLWLQSMTRESIRSAFEKLRPAAEMQNLTHAAVSRNESDWLVGINATRAMTAFNSREGGFQLTPVGRVQTPTLAILAQREVEIRDFKPREYFEVHAEFAVAAGTYRGRWLDESFKKGGDDQARAERIWDRARAEEIVAKCAGQPGVISEEKKPTSQIAPQLYDLTTLQREANSRFGLSARRTLQLAQALYERHKVLTYPRTDSRYLPDDYMATVKSTLGKLDGGNLAQFAGQVLESGWVRANPRVFNNARVTDHFAIIPTGASPKGLNDFELKIFDMVARRFVAVFFPAARFEVTTRVTRVQGEPFRTDGKILTEPGWLAVYGKQAATEDAQTLCAVAKGESAATQSVEIKENQTKPPARFNEGTLISAMEAAGKLVDDEELREAMSLRGLGTPATRAEIIEGLLAKGYMIHGENKGLVVTQKGLSLISLLRGIGVEALTSPEMTGEWEYKLKRMEQGEISRDQFMEEIRSFTEDIVAKAKNFQGGPIEGQYADLEAKCPKCGGGAFKETYKTYECRGCGLLVWKNMAGREFERAEVETLLQEGRVGPLEGFRSKLGRPFAAPVILDAAFKQTFDFGESKSSATANLDFATLPVIREKCPCCGKGAIHDTGTAYVCSNTAACKFRMGRTICQLEVPREQVTKLLETGKTDLIRNFISKKGKPFSAFLKIEEGRVGFEFEERKSAAAKPRPTTRTPRKG